MHERAGMRRAARADTGSETIAPRLGSGEEEVVEGGVNRGLWRERVEGRGT